MKYIATVLFSLILCSCITQEKCIAKFPPQVTKETNTIIEYRDTIIEGGTVEKLIHKDSLVFLPGEIKTYIDTSGSAILTFYKNQYGELVASCEAKDKRIEKLSQKVTEKEVIEKINEIEVRHIPWYLIALLSITSLFSIPTALKYIKLII